MLHMKTHSEVRDGRKIDDRHNQGVSVIKYRKRFWMTYSAREREWEWGRKEVDRFERYEEIVYRLSDELMDFS